MARNARILKTNFYILSLMKPQCNAFIDYRAVSRGSLQSVIKRVGGSQDIVKQPDRAKIEFLREVKSKTVILKCHGCEIEKFDLSLNGKASAGVNDLLMC